MSLAMVQRLIPWVFLCLAIPKIEAAQLLTLDSFLSQVREGNEDYRAALQFSQGAGLASHEGKLLIMPQLFGELSYGEDKTEPESPTKPNDVRGTNYVLGVAEQSPYGVGAKVTYSLNHYDLRGAPPTIIRQTEFYRSQLAVQLSVPLYRNFFGSETMAQKSALESADKATEQLETLKSKQLLATAEADYWRLALARKLVQSAKENLDRAGKIIGWSTRRKNLGLADESSFLQADANHELRDLEYKSAVDEVRAASRRFNTLRGVSNDEVGDLLAEPSPDMLAKLSVPEKYTEREDVVAARSVAEAKKALAQLAKEKFKPSVDLVGLYAWNGKEVDRGDAIDESKGNSDRAYGIGIKFTMPLDIGTLAKQQRGYSMEQKAAELELSRAEFEGVRTWNDIRQRFIDGRERFANLQRLELAQRKKLDRERDLQGRGRSTLFNVLQFESEYASATIARTRVEIDLLSLYAVLKTYGPNGISSDEGITQ